MNNDKGTYHLWELTNKGSTEEIYELARLVAETRPNPNFILREDKWDEEAQTVLFGVHQWLWQQPRTSVNDLPPYTHKLVNATSVMAALRAVYKNVWPHNDMRRIAQAAYSILSHSQLLIRRGAGAKNSQFYIRAWPEGFVPQWKPYKESVWLPMRDEVDIQRQQEKAEKLAGPVKVYTRLEVIPRPEATPESVMRYIEAIVGLVRRLEAENEELRDRVAEKDGWSSVVSDIENLIGGE